MTCIVALKDRESGKVWMGGDSAGVDTVSMDLSVRQDAKVFKNGDYLIGFTSSFRMGQILRYGVQLPTPSDWDVDKFMVTHFVDAIKRGMEEFGFLGKTPSGRDDVGSFLVGWQDKLYVVYSDMQIGIHIDPFASIGCGSTYAHGALYTMDNCDTTLSTKDKVLLALKSAERHNGGVRGPFIVLST